MDRRVPTVIMRGGTSRAIFFLETDLPAEGPERDRVLLAAMGSPDRRQIDGLGGATSSTSKAAIIARGTGDIDIDIEYTFGQVGIDEPSVDYFSTCGNISAAVGPFAIDEGLVEASGSRTVVRIVNTNTGRIFHADLPVRNGRFEASGDYEISGVPGSGSEIVLTYVDPAGALTGLLTPSGNVLDTLEVDALGEIEASIVDVTSLYAFVRLTDLGLVGCEAPHDLNTRPDLLERIEAVRASAAIALGLAETPAEAARLPTTPRIVMVGPPLDSDDPNPTNLAVIAVSMGRIHETVPVTAAMCIAAATQMPGTLLAEALRSHGGTPQSIRIGHPAGVIEVSADVRSDGDTVEVVSVTSSRTARRLMEGHVFVPE
jgi:2-methylaconitate cis-trans-isomerase PrpF